MLDKIVLVQLDHASDKPLYLQLAEYITKLIEDREIPDNSKLPPVRKLASAVGINPNTAASTYKYLKQKGLVFSIAGSGCFTKKNLQPTLQYPNMFDLGSEVLLKDEEMEFNSLTISENSGANFLNLAATTPPPSLYPVNEFKEIMLEILDTSLSDAFSYEDSSGFVPLREALICFLNENYNFKASLNHTHIIAGAQQGIDIVSKALLRPNECVFVENPTYTGALAVFRSRSVRIISYPLLGDGPDLDFIDKYAKIHKPKLLYCMPVFQNPTGLNYSPSKMKGLLELADKHDFYILEDDLLSQFNYDRHNSRFPLKTFDSYDRVIYIKSFSKLMMPGLRTAVLVTPDKIKKRIKEARHITDISSTGLIQRAFDQFIRHGYLNSHINFLNNYYSEIYNLFINEFNISFSRNNIEYTLPSGGLSFWIKLNFPMTGMEFYRKCLSKNILITPGEVYSVSGADKITQYFKLGFAAVQKNKVSWSVASLLDVFLEER